MYYKSKTIEGNIEKGIFDAFNKMLQLGEMDFPLNNFQKY